MGEPPTTGMDTPSLRVIAVGLGGRERTLRAPGVEVIRTRTGFEALGELGLPIDGGASFDCRTVVLLDSGMVDPEEIPELASAMRRIRTDVRVAVLDGSRHVPDRTRAAVDGVFGQEVALGDLAGLFEPGEAGVETEPTSAEPDRAPPAREDEERREATEPERSAPSAGELRTPASTVLRAVLSGRDLPMAYLDRLGSGPWGERIMYIDVSQGIARPAQDHEVGVADVAHRGNRFGWLVGPAGAMGYLREAADELALCIAVQRQQEQLRDSAFRDHLTGAWNRRYFDRYLRRSLEEARALRRDLTVLLFDIDDFKHYNDAYGHAAGDEILGETVRLLRAVTRPTDEVCRVGGDEFAVIFYEPEGPREPGSTPPRSIFSMAHRFRQQICAHKFPKLGEQAKGRLTISGGLATFPWDGQDAESLVEHADRLLLQSKREGKNVICLGPGAMRVCGPEDDGSATGPPPHP